MKISSINLNFGKSLIAKCNIKDENQNKRSVSLYEYNPKDYNDSDEIDDLFIEGDLSEKFYKSFFRVGDNYSRFFILRDNKENKAFAASEVEYHRVLNNPILGNYAEIKNLESNQTYPNSLNPVIGFISKMAKLNDLDNIVVFNNNADSSQLGNYGFKKSKFDISIMPKKEYTNNTKKARTENNINYRV